jgi:anti-sigma B factor antagonist
MSDPRDSFELEERSDGERTVVALRGELDLATAGVVQERLNALRGDRRPVVLDLDGLTFIDSTGIRLVLESVRHREEEDWDFTVTRGSPVVRRLFATTSIAGRLPYAEGR